MSTLRPFRSCTPKCSEGPAPVSLPQEIVERYRGRAAVVGFEMDQVRTVNGTDVSVPINAVYRK